MPKWTYGHQAASTQACYCAYIKAAIALSIIAHHPPSSFKGMLKPTCKGLDSYSTEALQCQQNRDPTMPLSTHSIAGTSPGRLHRLPDFLTPTAHMRSNFSYTITLTPSSTPSAL
eukprot:1160439-Pelagomonas_calceolata.AAC.3